MSLDACILSLGSYESHVGHEIDGGGGGREEPGRGRQTCLIVDVKFEVGDVEEARVLVEVHHVRVHTRQVHDELDKAPQREVIRYL